MNITYNNSILKKDDKPWLPIMGEMQFSRTDSRYWRESLYKMKAAGIEIVSSYVMWNHHEEIKGRFDFDGGKNLRKFIRFVQEAGLLLLLRIGPWIHGEARNGGFPDWLMDSGIELRSDNKEYLSLVEIYFKELYRQAEGFMLKDGGPIVGIQLENEYGHCGGFKGEKGENHMMTLKNLAKSIGFDVPIYTATGWGGAVIGDCLPVWGGYCEAPWETHSHELPPLNSYIFTSELNDFNIGSDYGVKKISCCNNHKYPYLTAEVGSGMHVTYKRRPVVHRDDIGALIMVKLGSGANLMGYYVMHGGSNPKGIYHSLEEFMNYDHPGYGANIMPPLNYDFQAPIRQFGGIRDTFGEIKNLSMFCHDFGDMITVMPSYFPENNPETATNLTALRIAIRHDGKKGFLFINNYQRRYTMADHKINCYDIKLDDETISFKNFEVKNGEYFMLPFNFPVGEAIIKTAFATPLCRLNANDYVFFTDRDPEYNIKGELDDSKIITLTKSQALNAYKITTDKDRLYIADTLVMKTKKGVVLQGKNTTEFMVYPDLNKAPDDFEPAGKQNEFFVYKSTEKFCNISLETSKTFENDSINRYVININYDKDYNNVYLHILYGGNGARLYIDGEYVADEFYNGSEWIIGLKGFDFPESISIEIDAMREEEDIFLEQKPKFNNGVAKDIYTVFAEPEYISIIE